MRPLQPRSPRAHPAPAGGATSWRDSITKSAVGATVAVVVTTLLGAMATWFFQDDDNSSEGGSPGGKPFTWVVTPQIEFCPRYVVEESPNKVSEFPLFSEQASWAAELGARPAHPLVLQLTLQGKSSQVVVLDSLRIKVESAPKFEGGVYMLDPCPHPVQVPLRGFRAKLDPAGPTIPMRPMRAGDFPFSISLTEPEVFNIVVAPGNCNCDWTLQLAWTSGDQSGTETIDDNGEPFRSASRSGRVHYVYDSDRKEWVENPVS